MDRLDAFVLIGLFLLIGTEVLRRQVIAEFPDEAGSENRTRRRGERVESVKQGAAGGWKRASTAVAGIGSSRKGKQEPADPETARLERLQQLNSLKDSGALTDEEFAEEKRRLLAASPDDDPDG
ncbi:MAG: SHOCT domain-containing protein [Thermoleophilia bacterium]|nr:SHOCT domain-containing protein [Thermoleophilia bacterium]